MDFNRPESLVSVVTENGSGSLEQGAYDLVRGARGQITGTEPKQLTTYEMRALAAEMTSSSGHSPLVTSLLLTMRPGPYVSRPEASELQRPSETEIGFVALDQL